MPSYQIQTPVKYGNSAPVLKKSQSDGGGHYSKLSKLEALQADFPSSIHTEMSKNSNALATPIASPYARDRSMSMDGATMVAYAPYHSKAEIIREDIEEDDDDDKPLVATLQKLKKSQVPAALAMPSPPTPPMEPAVPIVPVPQAFQPIAPVPQAFQPRKESIDMIAALSERPTAQVKHIPPRKQRPVSWADLPSQQRKAVVITQSPSESPRRPQIHTRRTFQPVKKSFFRRMIDWLFKYEPKKQRAARAQKARQSQMRFSTMVQSPADELLVPQNKVIASGDLERMFSTDLTLFDEESFSLDIDVDSMLDRLSAELAQLSHQEIKVQDLAPVEQAQLTRKITLVKKLTLIRKITRKRTVKESKIAGLTDEQYQSLLNNIYNCDDEQLQFIDVEM